MFIARQSKLAKVTLYWKMQVGLPASNLFLYFIQAQIVTIAGIITDHERCDLGGIDRI
jgi:hypothetical protein